MIFELAEQRLNINVLIFKAAAVMKALSGLLYKQSIM